MTDIPPNQDAPGKNVHSDGTFAGYRLVRKLGIGSRADVFLASGSTGTVALKVFAPEVTRESVGTELDALGRVDSPHVVRLLDIASSHSSLPTLVLERVRRGSIAGLLRERTDLEAGEAVTLLAPLAGVLPQLHRAGVAHGAVGPTSIHLGSGGEPVLLGFGHCTLFARDGTIAAIDAQAAVVRDREALAAVAKSVLGHVRRATSDRRIQDILAWIDTRATAYEFASELESRLFDLADSMPIDLGRISGAASAVPARIGRPVPAVGQTDTEPAEAPPQHWLPAALLENPVLLVKQRILSLVRGVRKPLWVVAGAVLLAFVLALSLIPSGQTSTAQQAPAQNASTSTAAATDSPVGAPSAAALPDDPLLALPILLRDRATCFRDLSILCLDNVDESSSGAFLQDSALIQQIQQGGEIATSTNIDSSSLSLVERLGDSALISLSADNSGAGSAGADSEPASILLIRGASGWRIRDLLSRNTPAP